MAAPDDPRREAQRIAREVLREVGTKRAAARVLGLGAVAFRSVCGAPERCQRTTIRKVLAVARRPARPAGGWLPVVIQADTSLPAALRRAELIASRLNDPALSRRLLTLVSTARRGGSSPDLAPLAAALDQVPGCGRVCPDDEWHFECLTGRLECIRCGQAKQLERAPARFECLTCGRGLAADRTVVKETSRPRGLVRKRGGMDGP